MGIADLHLENRLRVSASVYHWYLSKQLSRPEKNPSVAEQDNSKKLCAVRVLLM